MGYKPTTSTTLIILANILIPISLLVFATGFFPYKPYLPGLAEYEALELGPPPAGPFDKLIFMVVDALRSLIRDGGAVPFTANARSPTVTMPRIKSITTGSIPSFVDLILNIDEGDTSSSLAVQDTWLAQLKAKNMGKLLMYGDDTWLKLFPDTFDREEGTTSFFVSDFTEVDNNVTRNIAPELERSDWGLMVLHYLGLDHIGHKSGPRSVNMVPKQQEMDNIVKSIYESIEKNHHLQSTLFVICGDHGMNDAGNHGASSPGETSPALLFISPKMKALGLEFQAPIEPGDEFDYYSQVEQSDLAPTIAALLGFPVPKNNLGAFIPEFLPFWDATHDRVQILFRNARQILQIVTAAFGSDMFTTGASTTDPCAAGGTDVDELACEWRKINQQVSSVAKAKNLDKDWQASMSSWLRNAQNLMSSMASNYDVSKLFLGQGLAIVALVFSVAGALSQGQRSRHSLISLFAIAVPYGLMMFASSYVEEEQHFWYWSTTLWLAYLGSKVVYKTKRLSSFIWPIWALAALRITRGWNQTGQKFAGESDIVKRFLLPQPEHLWLLIGATYCLVFSQTMRAFDGIPRVLAAGLTSILVTSAFAFKLAFTAEDVPELVADGYQKMLLDLLQGPSLLFKARLVFALLAICAAYGAYHSLTGGPRAARISAHLLHHLYTVLAMTQSRAANIPLLLLSNMLLRLLEMATPSVTEITITSVLLQFTTFFAYGGSNAISSVDLSSAYNGVGSFSVFTVGILTLISNWAAPIFWTSGANLLLLHRYRLGNQRVFARHLVLLTTFTATTTAFVMAACTVLRTHLFIWTVFSPKYLYSMAWSIGQHLLLNVGFGGLLYWLGAR
ncbi:ethanolamine phosphate transferase 2 subunit G [Geosmithia morbida]|uniref:GPI ethanolamine phosphate transferase 2 n=1 Tax=Geosmithia morbida TaxID=1094350 RepID=A0A9P4YR45_9HYPO|nr:ethanolamine phosphate transferase 2 subunit G [Geosmithia morbida]KAF4120292.1 ethanolamine phosphate transferase 2 subunit G [Geosmithia morbida]